MLPEVKKKIPETYQESEPWAGSFIRCEEDEYCSIRIKQVRMIWRK